MRLFLASIGGALVLTMVTAPLASAATREHPSSNTPWVIGLIVIVLIVVGLALMKLRSGASRRREPGHFRDE